MGAFVPLHLGPFSYTFEDDRHGDYDSGVPHVVLTDSTASFSAPAGADYIVAGWELAFTDAGPEEIRVTVTDYMAGQLQSGNIYHAAYFESATGLYENSAAPSPSTHYPDDSGVAEFAPSEIVFLKGSGAFGSVYYRPTAATGDRIDVDQNYQMLIEVWDPDAAEEPSAGFWTNLLNTTQSAGSTEL